MANKQDVLCINEVLATFEGIQHQPCRFMTADCPDHCDHATDLAIFKVDQYLKYEKKGEYGDDKAEEFYWDLKATSDSNKLHPEYIDQVKALKKGDKVKLNWTHFYVYTDSANYPERCVTFFEKA